MTEAALTEYDSIFCANSGCLLHVRPGDSNVRGSGNWAQLDDGTILGLCDRCAERVMRGEVALVTRPVGQSAA